MFLPKPDRWSEVNLRSKFCSYSNKRYLILVIKDVLEQTSARGSKFGTLESKVSHMVSMVAHWKPSTFHNVVRKSQEALSSFVEEHQEIEEMDETEDSDEVFEIDLGNYISRIFFLFRF